MMKIIAILIFFILPGCLNYPGGPNDIAKYNDATRAYREKLDKDREIAEAHRSREKAEREKLEKEVAERNKKRFIEAEQNRINAEEKGKESLQNFVNETETVVAQLDYEKHKSQENNVKYKSLIEKNLKNKFYMANVDTWCSLSEAGDLILCAIQSKVSTQQDPHLLHNLQWAARETAVELKRVYPVSYAIIAQTGDSVPIARFDYNYQFDHLSELLMWR